MENPQTVEAETCFAGETLPDLKMLARRVATFGDKNALEQGNKYERKAGYPLNFFKELCLNLDLNIE